MTNSSYAKKLFGKDLYEVCLGDIQDFFLNPQEETSVLEFKSGGVQIDDVYAEVAAFLNTEGGLIIIGSPKETRKQKGNHRISSCQGELTYSSFSSKDWLIQKIASNIIPSPTEIKIKEFITEEGAVFLIDVYQSTNPPHQVSSSGKYYIRMECEAKPAPHGIVQALFDKRKKPLLNHRLEIKEMVNNISEIIINIVNESDVPADNLSTIINVFNVNEVTTDENYAFKYFLTEDKYATTIHTGLVLARVISATVTFNILHKKKPYILLIGYWARNMDFDFKFYTYDPRSCKILCEGSHSGDAILEEELKKIRD